MRSFFDFQTGEIEYDNSDSLYLKLNQTTPQTIINGGPIFDAGLTSNNDISIKSGFKLILDA